MLRQVHIAAENKRRKALKQKRARRAERNNVPIAEGDQIDEVELEYVPPEKRRVVDGVAYVYTDAGVWEEEQD